MRLLGLELKRVLKSRITIILLGAALALSIAMAMLVISYTEYHYLDESGQEQMLTGVKAIDANRKMMEPYKGELTAERIAKVIEMNRELEIHYGEEIPKEEVYEKQLTTSMILGSVRQVYTRSDGLPLSLSEITDLDARNFYKVRDNAVMGKYLAKYPNAQQAQEKATSINGQVKTPFTFIYGYANSDAADYVLLYMILLGFICVMIMASVFSSEYQTGADDILRCTKNGRKKLACSKIAASLVIFTILFVISISIYLLIVNTAYGWDSLDASAQFMYNVTVIAPLTAGETQLLTVAAGFLGLASIICFTLWISSWCKTAMLTMMLALAGYLLPTILTTIGKGNLISWLCCLLPSGGVGLTHSFFFELMGDTFLQAGSLSIWSPYVIVIAALIEIPLFFLLAIRTYCRHEA